MKYLMIDGNNLAIRSAFANETLSNSAGVPTGVHYGVFNSLIALKQNYPDYQFVIMWDGKSQRRMAESQEGVKRGYILSAYKENRKKDDQPKPLLDFFAQAPFLKKGIEQAGIPQMRLSEYETDDVIASYCNQMSKDNEIVVVTSDKDYFQLLSPNVSLWDGMKSEKITLESFKEKYGIEPNQTIDVGALMGDDGDNIHGIPGWGEKTALEAIKENGNWQKVYEKLHLEYGELRKKFPDITDAEEFKKLTDIKTDSGKQKYPEITVGLPYSGLALAVEQKKTKTIKKNILMALMMEERVRLAYSLKKMDSNIESLPEIVPLEYNRDRLVEYFDYYEMYSLKSSIDILKG